MLIVYKGVTNRGRTSINVLEKASKDIDNDCSVRESAKKCGCNRLTLKRFFDKRTTKVLNLGDKAISTCHVFSAKMESELADH